MSSVYPKMVDIRAVNNLTVIIILDTGELEFPTKLTLYLATAVKKKAIANIITLLMAVTGMLLVKIKYIIITNTVAKPKNIIMLLENTSRS